MRKMKKIIILLAIIPILLNAQDNPFDCQFIPPEAYFDREEYTGRSDMTIDYGNPFIFNVEFHLIYENGVPAHDITEDELLKIIAVLNINFNDLDIFFKYTGFNFLEATTFPDFDYVNGTPSNLNDVIDDFTQLGLYHDNVINIFILNMNGNSSHFWDETAINNFNQYTENMITHEFGHILGLLHVFSGAQPNQISLPENHPCSSFQWNFFHQPVHQFDSENITRDINDSNYNASGANAKGDLIHDTEACFYFFRTNMCQFIDEFVEDYRVYDNSYYPDTECYYCDISQLEFCYTNGSSYYTVTNSDNISTDIALNSNTWQDIINSNLIDCDLIESGIMYRGLETINHNYMSYGTDLSYFTTGQKIRMYQTIYSDTDLQQKLAKLPDGSADFSVLYEPYKVIEGTSGFDPDINYYQPGFDYEFITCSADGQWGGYSPDASNYDDITFDIHYNGIYNQFMDKYFTPYDELIQPDHTSILIPIIDNLQPRKCLCSMLKLASGGSVTKFNDGIINTNITVYPKDSLQINDSNLIHNLNSGLYKIDKQFIDGSQEQNVILKDDE